MSQQQITSAEELALIVEEVQDYAMLILSPTGEIRSWNRGAERIFGYTADEVVGRHCSIFYPDDDPESMGIEQELEAAATTGRIEVEGWRQRKDDRRFWANTVITALRKPNGQLRGFAKITRDLTEKRKDEEDLRQSEEMFRLLVSSVEEYAIFLLDPQGYVVSWNAGARRIKGYEAEEIIGKHFSVFYRPEDAAKPPRELKEALADGRVEDEGWRVRKDGSMFWANVVITRVLGPDGELRGFAKVTRDFTDRRQAEETRRALLEQREARLQAEEERRQAEASYRASEETNRAKDEFLMTLSHELRTPMTAIVGWSRLLPMMDSSDPTFDEAIKAINRSAQHQAQLLEDVLDVSRVNSGKLRLSVSRVEVLAICQAALTTVRPAADGKGIRIETDLSPSLGEIFVDPTRLQQMVWNLLANAVKFTPGGGTITLKAWRESSQLYIQVRDTGEGIAPDFLSHMFEPFSQHEGSTTRVHGGLGLGLSIVRYLAEAHGGTISAESPGRGKGSTFTLSLPVRSDRTETPELRGRDFEANIVVASPSALNGLRILQVDDDREGRELVLTVLKLAGAEVREADSVSSAWRILENWHPDVIVTDIAMPYVDGFEFVRQLRANDATSAMKIVALTAFQPGESVSVRGFDDYLVKPIDPGELVNRVVALMRPDPTPANRPDH